MAVLISQTREQIRVSIGYNVGAVYVSTMTGNGSTTTGVDSTLENSDDYINGDWVRFTSGTNDGSERVINDYAGSSTTWTVRGDAVTSTVDGDTYELWDDDMPPQRIHDFINRAIRAIPRKASPPSTSYAIHTGGGIRSFDIPTALVGIQEVEYRAQVVNETVLLCDAAFDESVTTDVTATLDQEDKRHGSGSARFQIAAGVGTGLIASDSISSLDLRGYTHIEFWAKSSVATAANDLVLRLSSTANAGTGTDDLNIPALTADTWTYLRLALGNPESDNAIISVGLRQAVDIGAAFVWLDDIKAVRDDAGVWRTIHRDHWRIDKDERELVLSEHALDTAGYSLLKLVGVKKPTELTADATACDVEPEYIIAKATALAMRARGDRKGDSREAAHQEADRWEALAQQALQNVQTPQRVRWVDDA